MTKRLNLFKKNGMRAAVKALWLRRRETIQQAVLVLLPEPAAKKKRKNVALSGQFLSSEELHIEASKRKPKKPRKTTSKPKKAIPKQTLTRAQSVFDWEGTEIVV
ncbi:hypothetical protein PR001_g495 [Phytophthora rubi]|uniref:Uncharacterized protein n=1 Tax=Phytophthora rubi TaxID=129364 RepID=A0A6A3P3A5_9STRA|nr:hypothetical protein PR001_g495 [Phytophthora rubi]